MSPITILEWSTARGLIQTTRHTTGRRRPISATASLRPDLLLAPVMRSAIGGQEVIGAATLTGVAAATTSTSLRLAIAPPIRSPAAAINGNRESIIVRPPEIAVSAIFAAVAANRCSTPAPSPATDLVLVTNLATDLVPVIGQQQTERRHQAQRRANQCRSRQSSQQGSQGRPS